MEMTLDDFVRIIKPKLKAAYGGFGMFSTESQSDTWYESLKMYALSDVEYAVNKWIQTSRFKPTPAEIIGLLPVVSAKDVERFDPTPRYVDQIQGDGRVVKVRAYQCRICKDTGLIITQGESGYPEGQPCNCAAGHNKYHWGWLSEEQQRDYIKKNGYHGEKIGESWYR